MLAGLTLMLSAAMPVTAAELYRDDAIAVRWDNLLRYTLASRVARQDTALLDDLNWDDGDRNFTRGLISNRLDILSALDMTAGDWGLHASAAAWYDQVYRNGTDAPALPAANAGTAAPGRFAPAVRDLYGQHAEWREGFVYGSFTVADMPLSLRVGRQTLLWGESLFYDPQSIAAAQAPVDYTRPVGVQSAYSSDTYRPVGQVSLTLQPTADLALSFYHQLEWRPTRLAGSGTYFSYLDQFGAGADRLYVAPGRYLVRRPDREPSGKGQFGLSLHAVIGDVDYGLYALRYNALDPQHLLRVTEPATTGPVGYYRLVYPGGIQLYGASVSASVGDGMVSGEASLRRHMPLYLAGSAGSDGSVYNAYVTGQTLHGQLSVTQALGRSALWDSADLNAETMVDKVLDHDPVSFRPQWKGTATKIRVMLEPRYFRVLPNLDLTVPIGVGYTISGHSFGYRVQNAGAADMQLAVTATYRSVWKASLSLTRYMGPPAKQWLSDRDYLALSVTRTF